MWKLLFSSTENRNKFYTLLLPKWDPSKVNTRADVNACRIWIFPVHPSLTGIYGALSLTGTAEAKLHSCLEISLRQSCSQSLGLGHTQPSTAENQRRGAQPKSCSHPLITRQEIDTWGIQENLNSFKMRRKPFCILFLSGFAEAVEECSKPSLHPWVPGQTMNQLKLPCHL